MIEITEEAHRTHRFAKDKTARFWEKRQENTVTQTNAVLNFFADIMASDSGYFASFS